ncbi:GNAT family N-acetyltransferase [Hymenobacter sp. HD11105]
MSKVPSAIHPLTWDSDFLGYAVARLNTANLTPTEVAAAVGTAREAGIKLLYGIADPTTASLNAALQQQGGWLADRKTTFAIQARMPDETTSAPYIRSATAYTPQLELLAWQSGEYSRFRLDPRFEVAVFQRLYSQWLRNSLAGTIARQVLVWRNAELQELGLLTLGEKNQRADIGLLAVDAIARGQRIGQQLIAAAHAWAISQGYAELQVVTQGDNVPACAFYTKCGFVPVHIEHIYHLWLS